MPETAGQAGYYAKPGTGDGLAEMLLDIHGERLDLMNAHNVEHFVLVPLPSAAYSPVTCSLPPSLVPSSVLSNPCCQVRRRPTD
jgi:hypothetical protein